MEKRFAIGVDVGGSHVSCTTYDLKKRQLVEGTRRNLSINNKGSKEEIISCFVELIQPSIKSINKDEFAGVGIAMPGPFDYSNGIGQFTGDNVKYLALNQINVCRELSDVLNVEERDVRFINDATAFALGEYFNGQLKGAKNGLAITLGTGFGAAFLSEGIPVINDSKVPKEGSLWHLPFEGGIADSYFSTRGLVKRYAMISNQVVEGVKDLAVLYETDKNAQQVFADFGMKLAEFLIPWIKSFEVESLVIGGNISRAFKLFESTFNETFIEEGIQISVGVSELLEDAAFIGAANLQNDIFFNSIKNQLKFM